MLVTTQAFKRWLKSSNNMKLSSDAVVPHLTHEGIANLVHPSDFNKKRIKCLPNVFKNSIPDIDADSSNNVGVEAAISRARISSILVGRLIVVVNTVKKCGSISRFMNLHNMRCSTVLATYKSENEPYLSTKDEAKPQVPKINDRDNDCKVIRCYPIFKGYLTSSDDSRGPLTYVLRRDPIVPDEIIDSLLTNYCHRGGRSLISELECLLSHEGLICKNSNATVYRKINLAVRRTLVESTIKSFSRCKDGRGVFQDLIANHSREVKHCSI